MKAMLLVSSVLLFSASAFSDYESARDAYNRKDYATALKELQPFADEGDAKSQYLLGWLYDNGYGVIEDDQTAVKWYALSANQGEGGAQYNLGWMYEAGNGVDQDYKTAVKWYGLAAAQGRADGQFKLGWMHEKGRGVDQNNEAAFKWYKLAAEQGHGTAQNNLGVLYANGKGVKQDVIQGYMWWDIAAAQRAGKAAQNLYFLRKKMTPADIATAEGLARECTAKKYKGCFPETQSAKGAVVLNVLAVEKTKKNQPFQFSLNGPIEERKVMDGQSFLIVDLEYTNPNSFSVTQNFGEKSFSLWVDGVLSPSTAYVWSDANQTYLDARDMSTIQEATGYWYKHSGGGRNLSARQTRHKKIMFAMLDTSSKNVEIQVEGMTNKIKHTSRLAASWDNECVAQNDDILSVAAFVTRRGGLEALGTTYAADVFDQFVIEVRNALKTASIVKAEFSSKLLSEGETKAQYFKRKGCETYLELSVTPTFMGAQVISGGTLGKKQRRVQIEIVGDMINTSDNSTIWKDSYRHTCRFLIGTLRQELESILEGSEEERNQDAAKKSECGRSAGKKFAGSFLEAM